MAIISQDSQEILVEHYKIAIIKEDGIGSEIINKALKVLKVVAEKFGFDFKSFKDFLIPASVMF